MLPAVDLLANNSVLSFLDSDKEDETVPKEKRRPRDPDRQDLFKRLTLNARERPARDGTPGPTRTATAAMDLVLSAGTLSPPQISWLQFLRMACTYTADLIPDSSKPIDPATAKARSMKTSVAILDWILPDMRRLPASLSHADGLVVLIEGSRELEIENVTAEALGQLRNRVFGADPLRVIRYLMQEEKFVIDEDVDTSERLSEVAEKILAVALDANIGIVRGAALTDQVAQRFVEEGEEAPDELTMETAITCIQSAKNLSRITDDAHDVVCLYNKNFRSVRQIAQAALEIFRSEMKEADMPEAVSAKIHDRAERVDCWSEHRWLALLESSRREFTSIKPRPETGGKPPPGVGASVNNLTDIFRLEDRAVDPCCSVTSLSAYFAYLMNELNTTRTATDSVLDILRERRPDLYKLELSCANSQTLIPYVCLVNEVLESYIRSKEGSSLPPRTVPSALMSSQAESSDVIAPYTTPSDASSDDHPEAVYRPGTTDDKVYTLVAKQMFPFTYFPYDRSRDAVEQFLSAFEIRMTDFTDTFASPRLLLQDLQDKYRTPEDTAALGVQKKLLNGIDEVLERQRAAETIGLKQADFAAITGETFFPGWLAELMIGLAKKKTAVDTLCPWNAAALWGYTQRDAVEAKVATATECMLDLKSQAGLSFIKYELIRRSGLELAEILELARSQCFGQHLVITNETGSKDFDGGLEDLRLLSNATSPPFSQLTEELCFSLQAFLRLKAKLGWSTKQLDAAIFSLRNLEMGSTPGTARKDAVAVDSGCPSELPSISAFTIKNIAAIVKLAELSGVGASTLLALWGPIDAYGSNSVLQRQFLTRTVREVDSTFSAPTMGENFLQDGESTTVDGHREGLCASLKWPDQSLNDLLEMTGLHDAKLSVTSFSTLFRHVLLCRILGVAPTQCAQFFSLFFSAQEYPLANPIVTLKTIQNWKSLLDAGWTVESLSTALPNELVDTTPSGTGLATTAVILDGARDIRKTLPFLAADAPNAQDIADCIARMFEGEEAASMVRFVEGTETRQFVVSLERKEYLQSLSEACANSSWPQRLLVAPDPGSGFRAEFSLRGVLSNPEWNQIKIELGRSKIPAQKVAEVLAKIDEAKETSQRPWAILQGRIGNTEDGAARLDSSVLDPAKAAPALPASPGQGRSPEEAFGIQQELEARKRRKAFLDIAAPTIVQELLETLITTAAKDLVPELDPSLLSILMSRVVQVDTIDGASNVPAMEALQHLAEASNTHSDSTEPLDAYFTPATTDMFTLSLDNNVSPENQPLVKLRVNGLDIRYDQATKKFGSFRMTGGQSYLLEGNFPLAALSWSTPKVPSSSFTGKVLVPSATARRASQIETAIRRAASICQTLKLTAEELEYISMPKTSRILDVDLNRPTLDDLVRMQRYRKLRDAATRGKAESSLTKLFSWMSSTDETTTLDQLAARIAETTGWKLGRVSSAIRTQNPGMTDAQRVESMKSLPALFSLQDILRLDDQFVRVCGANSQMPMTILFGLASPRKTLSADYSSHARSLEMRLTPTQREMADDALMQTQRRALVEYLLQQPYVRVDLKIWDADGLFEYFLVDVQMGPQLRTSRVKQAISVIQLFAQRCLLGLEPKVSKDTLPREKWEWIQQYSLWEANRKLFLYPENWLDPGLRDDKSELFVELEASLMQKDLSMNTFLEATKTYISGLNEISRLEIVAYLLEQRGNNDIYHIFGRTRTAPYALYYRKATVIRESTEPPRADVMWRPWVKLDVDVGSVENEWDGKRLESAGLYILPLIRDGRLYLFMAQTTPKSVGSSLPVGNFDSFKGRDVGSGSPEKVWEVTLAWTEHSHGSWAPKRVSPGSLTVQSTELSSVSQFRMDPILDGEVLSLMISVSKGSKESKNIGQFVFTSDQVRVRNVKQIQGSDNAATAQRNAELWAPSRPVQTWFQRPTVDLAAGPTTTYGEIALPSPETEQQREAAQLFRARNVVWFVPPALDTHVRSERAEKPEKPISLMWTFAPGQIKPQTDTLDKSIWQSKIGGPYTGFALGAHFADGSSASYFSVPVSNPNNTWWTPSTLRSQMELAVIDHRFSHELMKATATHVEPLRAVYAALATSSAQRGIETWGARCGVPAHELGQPSALYNWEIGLHAVMLAVDRLCSTQQFEEALELARLVFDPTAEVPVKQLVKTVKTDQKDRAGNLISRKEVVVSLLEARAAELVSPATTQLQLDEQSTSCWRFPPFQEVARQIVRDKGKDALDMEEMDRLLQPAIMERKSHGALVHATARGRPTAYMKWIIMKYVDILVASGDVHFRKSTLESLPLATQRYVEAAHVLGPLPPRVPQLAKRNGRGLTFAELIAEDDEEDDALRLKKGEARFELDAPFSPELQEGDRKKERIVGFLKTKYFGIPLNPRFAQLRALVNVRLFNIRNGLDIQGRPVSYSLIEPPIDPGALMALDKAGFGMSAAAAMVMGDRDSPLPRQRFEVLVQRASELCAELRGLGERMLAAVEKKEMEAFNVLRVRHTAHMQRMMLDIRETHLEEAQQVVNSLRISRDSQVSQLAYYLALIGEPTSRLPSEKDPWVDIEQDIDAPTNDDMRMSRYEKEEMDKADSAAMLGLIAQGIDTLVAPFFVVPTISVNAMPLGVGTTAQAPGGNSIASMMQAGSSVLRFASMIQSDKGSRAARKAQLTRQLQDRRFQANMRGREIKNIDKQIEIQKLRVKAAQKEIEQQKAEIEESMQIEAWYRTKYTDEQLYSWVEKNLRGLYFQAYTLALATARRAESALAFERGRSDPILRPGGYWDASRDGLLAADHLYLDLKRLDSLHLESRFHDYEVTKTISLRQIDPLALMRLRISGSTTFSLDEVLFDMDFPGHYMRRIRSVAVSIPAILGPHSSVNATLSLLSHKYRTSSVVTKLEDYSTTTDPSFRTDHVPISSVAISTGSRDPGVFELGFGGPRYMPFEGAGAISTWRLDLPSEVRRFDYESISDVLLHVQYTALEGGACLRAVANDSVRGAIRKVAESEGGRQTGLFALFDLKNDFANEWFGFASKIEGVKRKGGAAEDVEMMLGDVGERLPFWTRQQQSGAGVEVMGITLIGRDVGFVDGLGLSAVVGNAEPGKVGEWRVRSWNGLSERDLKGWKITARSDLLKGDKVGNVHLLVRYVLAGKTAGRG
ncbi:hypothetical protein B0T14DRAFT_606722 [Immersiella caudata]|uniref:Uncharacterized protein n=1 Tax=Immersiella caudata TaxID=314043 RepID=A0AA39WFJ2_9PEZI|nr:hypothetical protein B0T14DRAFT_606722 [Immersiella caudata]